MEHSMHTSHNPQVVALACKRLLGTLLLPLLALSGCEGMSHADAGILGGGAFGAVAGTIVGGALGRPGLGAAIGAGTGAIAGGAIGAHEDKVEHREAQAAAAAVAQRGPLGLEEIAKLSQQHVGDGVIIEQIRTSGYIYNLTVDQIIWLRQSGVSDVVIQEMQLTTQRAQRVYVAPPPGVVVVEDRPPVVGIGFVGYRRRW
jgi:Glycine zipper